MEIVGKSENPTHYTGDIVIQLRFMPAGKNVETAQAFVDETNRWREMFGRPAVEVGGEDPGAVASRFLDTLHYRTGKAVAFLILGVPLTFIAGLFLYRFAPPIIALFN